MANGLIIAVVVVYMLFMLWIGWYSSKRINSNTDFMVAGRRLGPFLMAGTLAATEIGGGVVPMDADARAQREAAGRLSCLLAERADTVVRVCCGLPQLLKGEWPCASG